MALHGRQGRRDADGVATEATSDPDVMIEERREGYIRYRHRDGRRWAVRGTCDKRGDCLVGAVIDGEHVTTLERARELALAYEGPDVPVGPGFKGCCPLTVEVLDADDYEVLSP